MLLQRTFPFSTQPTGTNPSVTIVRCLEFAVPTGPLNDFLLAATRSSIPRENFDDGMREFAIRDIHGYIFQFRQEVAPC
jgi:hypothetical protein